MTLGATLRQALSRRAEEGPDRLALLFVGEDGRELTYTAQQYEQQARAYAQRLEARGVKRGDLLMLVLRHSPELLFAFWGALYLGAIPSIFPFLTEKLDADVYRQQVQTLAAQAQARVVITFPEFKGELERLLDDGIGLVLSSSELKVEPCAARSTSCPDINADTIAFLQHSSGTTGLQKGIALSHRAVLNQIDAYSAAIELRSEDVVVSWLPLYHDMGLIAGFVMPLVTGTPLVLLSPFHWVRDPAVLFRTAHKHQGTICWLPNFAYNHSVRATREREVQGLDLAHWRMLINCSEPVRHDSHQQFLRRFGPLGLRAEALATCYAMAENTFAVTQSPPSREARVDWVVRETLQREGHAAPAEPGSAGATAVVSCGYPISGTEIQIVDRSARPVGPRVIGEIAIRSNCLLQEYYRRPDLTRKAFLDGWYLSGDLGYLAGDQLYVTGRKKDLIIVGGKNVYCQDVEALANAVSTIYPGRTVAFGLPDERLGTESIILVCELIGDVNGAQRKKVESELRRRVLQTLGVTLGDVRLVQKRWLLKTSSGKIARSLNRDKYVREFRS